VNVVVPEPASLVLGGFGAIAVTAFGFRIRIQRRSRLNRQEVAVIR
jgi:hypothetical protein